MKKVRVRFAPSPTGGLHLGGVRTALFNYLFARQHDGDFILRIEDTDQTRYVPGAEEYIIECLRWCGIAPGEGPHAGGLSGPYRQSERKETYRKYAEQLVESGHAYYAFDTPEELEAMRERLRSRGSDSLQYDHRTRGDMRNSLTLTREEVNALVEKGVPHVIRIKIVPDEFVGFRDMIRGEVSFDTSTVDDKVLLKADGMPTYHLAVVADDRAMQITHVFRGEEWLPSAPVHILLWKWLGWEQDMPEWAHLPLILKPDGNGKLSKRDGDRLGFPVFAMNWTDPKTGEQIKGFREMGFLPEAFVNMLALLGWNDGTEQEIFSLEELVEKFSIGRVHRGGAKFNFEKAKWFNHEWIRQSPVSNWQPAVRQLFETNGIVVNDDAYLSKAVELVKDRCTLLPDFLTQAGFFFRPPAAYDADAVKSKWNKDKAEFFSELAARYEGMTSWEIAATEQLFKDLAVEKNIKPGELQLPLRVMLVGGKFGPPVFHIAELLGREETARRIRTALPFFG